jgi:hypothetical protein
MHCSKDDGRPLAGHHRKLRIAQFTVSTYGRVSTGAAGSLLRSSRQGRGDCGERQRERKRDLCHHGRSPRFEAGMALFYAGKSSSLRAARFIGIAWFGLDLPEKRRDRGSILPAK